MGIGGAVSSLGIEAAAALAAAGAPEILGSFLSGVVFNSLCFGIMMVGYVFGINLVFGIYEDVGYMARISYVFDSTMARFGLQGKSLMPFLMCFGCTMAAYPARASSTHGASACSPWPWPGPSPAVPPGAWCRS